MGFSEYDRLFEAQSGKCAICRLKPIEAVDHDHATGKFRGPLCHACNQGIGFFGDDTARITAALVYLTNGGSK